MKVSINARSRALLCLMLLLTSVVTSLAQFDTTNAAQITTRSVTLQQHTGVATGGSAIGGIADHQYTFTPTAQTIGSIGFQYCTTPTGTCTMPTGLVTTAATVSGLSASLSGWTITNTTNGTPYIKNGSAVAVPATPQTVTIANVTNPTTAGGVTFYVRITTYTGVNGSTGPTDTGTVAAATVQTITVNGTMPEYLQFCTGGTVTVNCGSTTSGAITFNQDFSTTTTATTTSQMAAATNAGTGYAITATGTTLTSGTNTIPTQGTSAAIATSTQGTSAWGINLVANSSPISFGAAIAPASSGATLQANPTTAYATGGSFAMDLTGATALAKSDAQTPGTSKPTLSQVYTVSYFANVSGIQPAGTYVATVNYVCTPTF